MFLFYRHDIVIKKLSTPHSCRHSSPTALHSGPHGSRRNLSEIAAVRPSFCRKIPSLFLPSTVLTHGIPRSNIIITKKKYFPERQCVHFLLRWWPTLAQLIFLSSFLSFSQTCALNSNMSQDTFKNEPDPRGCPSKWHPFVTSSGLATILSQIEVEWVTKV